MKNKFETTEGYRIVRNWMKEKGNSPFGFQHKTWEKFGNGYSGMVIAPTGFGKTYSVFLAQVIHFLNHPEQYSKGLKLLWITPLRSLAKDIAKAMNFEIVALDKPIKVNETVVIVNKNEQKLADEIEAALEKLSKDGTLQKISEKWYHRNLFDQLKDAGK